MQNNLSKSISATIHVHVGRVRQTKSLTNRAY